MIYYACKCYDFIFSTNEHSAWNRRLHTSRNFIGKIMEKAVVQQLTEHINRHHLYDDLQSAYRRGASTETAMLYIKTEAERILDAGNAVLMALLGHPCY